MGWAVENFRQAYARARLNGTFAAATKKWREPRIPVESAGPRENVPATREVEPWRPGHPCRRTEAMIPSPANRAPSAPVARRTERVESGFRELSATTPPSGRRNLFLTRSSRAGGPNATTHIRYPWACYGCSAHRGRGRPRYLPRSARGTRQSGCSTRASWLTVALYPVQASMNVVAREGSGRDKRTADGRAEVVSLRA